MTNAEQRSDGVSDLVVSREIANQVLFDTQDPEHEEGVFWESVKKDHRFAEIIHAILEHGSEQYRGLGTDAVNGYNGFIAGASMALESIRRALNEQRRQQ